MYMQTQIKINIWGLTRLCSKKNYEEPKDPNHKILGAQHLSVYKKKVFHQFFKKRMFWQVFCCESLAIFCQVQIEFKHKWELENDKNNNYKI